MSHLDRLLRDLIEIAPDERDDFFRLRSSEERVAIIELWAQSDRLTCTDIVMLSQPYQAELIAQVCGDTRKGLPSLGKVFVLEPVNGKPVRVNQGRRHNQRRSITIDRPTTMPADKAIHAMLIHGPNAGVLSSRDKLREVLPERPAAVAEPSVQSAPAAITMEDVQRLLADERRKWEAEQAEQTVAPAPVDPPAEAAPADTSTKAKAKPKRKR